MEKNKKTSTHTVEEPSWPELLGSKNWDGLLSPLNLSLRRFILLSGDFCQCTYDSFNDDQTSIYAGSCRYSKESFFHKVKFPAAGDYRVSSFIYATSTFGLGGDTWARKTNFMGYIAVSAGAGRREIHVVWRGTKTNFEWFDVAHFDSVPAPELVAGGGDGSLPPPRVMDGWLMLYATANPDEDSDVRKLSAREQVHRELKKLLEEYRHEHVSIVVNGHSLGAALAVLSAFDIAENVVGGSSTVTAIVFGCPQVGDEVFMTMVEQLPNLKILHIKNILDPIPLYPRIIEHNYRDVGIMLEVDSRKSPFLRSIPRDMMDWHNLQGILHVVAGWNGNNEEFELKVDRCVSLVNKSCGFLKDDSIPSSWWVVENKGMVLDERGKWVLAPPPDEEIHVTKLL